MIWSGLELSKLTGDAAYLDEALATAKAVASDLADPAGVFADLQAENDIVEPLVEAMYALATEAGAAFARVLDPDERGGRALRPGRRRLVRPLLRRPAPAHDRHRLADERRARARDRSRGARPGRRPCRPTTGGPPRAGSSRSLGPGRGDPLHRLGDRAPRHARRGLLRGRARARARGRPRDVRRDGHLAEQVEPRPPAARDGPLRLALAAAPAGTRSASRRACRTGRKGARSFTFAPISWLSFDITCDRVPLWSGSCSSRARSSRAPMCSPSSAG